ncbi:CmpA/NrtA family ABC transporter substrate-binding protein [Sphaerotilus hippei]
MSTSLPPCGPLLPTDAVPAPASAAPACAAPADPRRRDFVRRGAAAALVAAPALSWPGGVWAAGSDAPELREVRVGFIPLTDCASLVMASVLKLDEKHGIRIRLSKEPSWPVIRDKLASGELDAAHALYGLVYGMHLGAGGPKTDMAVLMTLNNNGQGITLSKALAQRGAIDGPTLARQVLGERREFTFAQTFPTGTHAMWLFYWLAAHGIHPLRDARIITVPPPQMVARMQAGNMDGYCVGEPWNHRAIADGVGITAATSQQVWPDHPEKVLGCTAAFVQRHPNTARALIMATLEASRWIDASQANRLKTAAVIAAPAHVNTSVDTISERILGHYQNGLGRTWDDANFMRFFNDGAVNYPYLSDGMWFITQHKRWGLMKGDVGDNGVMLRQLNRAGRDRTAVFGEADYQSVARAINQTTLYRQAASQLKINLPSSDLRSSRLIDGKVWDGQRPAEYAASFAIRAS